MSERFFPREDYVMRLAGQALEHDDVPIGAVPGGRLYAIEDRLGR